MMLTKGALGNLINRYRAVLKKCALINTFGSLAVAGMLVLGGASGAGAAEGTTVIVNNAKDLSLALSDSTSSKIIFGNDISVNQNLLFLTADKQLSIDGKNHTLTGAEYTGFIIRAAHDLSLENMTITEFNKRYFDYVMGGISLYLGGAVRLDTGTLKTVNMTFAGNSVGDIAGNNASYGGAVMVDGAQYSDTGSIFKHNQALGANGMGGAVSVGKLGRTSVLDFTNSQFLKNSATGTGGAVDLVQATATFSDVSFTGNNAGSFGGALRTNDVISAVFLVRKDAQYSGNTAGTGSKLEGTAYNTLYSDLGGFLYMQGGNANNVIFDTTANLTIGNDHAFITRNLDSIASAHGTGTSITKKGTGTLTVNGSMKAYTGAINVNAGTLNMATGFGEVSNGIQSRVNNGKTGNAALTGFKASTMNVASGATVTMDDLNITFAELNDSGAAAGTKITVNGTFKAGDVHVTSKKYTGAGDKNSNIVTTTGWGEFTIAQNATASIDSLTVDSGTRFDKKGAGVLTVKDGLTLSQGAVNVSGGTLDVAKITAPQGTLAVSDTGTLKTGSDQVFTTGLGFDGKETAAGNKKQYITFANGSLALTDSVYNLDYIKSAIGILNPSASTNKTNLVMLGKLADADKNNSIALSDLRGTGATLADVEVTTKGNLTIGNSGYANDLGVKNLDLGTGTSVTVQGGKTLTLVGDGSSELVKTTDEKGATVTVDKGTVQLGAEGANSGGTLNGSFELKNGTLNAVSGNFTINGNIIGDITNGSHVTVQNGNLTAHDVTNISTLELDKGGSLIAETFTTKDSSSTITVGSSKGGAGTFIAETADFKGASLFLDPAWINGMQYQDAALASRAAIKAFGTLDVNGKLTVGENSQLSLGTADVNWLTAAINNIGSTAWGKNGITAALGIYASQKLATNGGIMVDGSLQSNPNLSANTATFNNNSLLVVYAPNMLKKSALVGDGTSVLTVTKDAKLHIMGGKANDTVKIVSGFGGTNSIDVHGWRGGNLSTDSKLLTAKEGTFDTTKGSYDVTLSQNNATSLFPKLDKNLGSLVDGMVGSLGLNTNSTHYGQRFISRAVSESFGVATNAKKAATTIEGAAKIAFAGAAPQLAISLANAAGNVAGLRNSLATETQGAAVAMNDKGALAHEGLSAGEGMQTGFGVWVLPTYQNQQAFGLDSGKFETGYTSNAAGVIMGADYTFNSMVRVGAQFNVGGGYAESTGDFNSTDNRFNYWGLGVYAGYQYENIGLTADFGYSNNKNKIEQTLPTSLQMPALKADANSDTISAGLRGEYKFATESLDIVPYIGVRMTTMHIGSFDIKSDKHKVLKADDINATVWTFPVGVTLAKDIETANGWTIKPSLDLAVVPAAGDVKTKQDVKIAGVNGAAQMESSIMDRIAYQGSLGLSAKHNNGVSMGVNYTVQAGAHTTDHGVQATFRYEF